MRKVIGESSLLVGRRIIAHGGDGDVNFLHATNAPGSVRPVPALQSPLGRAIHFALC